MRRRHQLIVCLYRKIRCVDLPQDENWLKLQSHGMRGDREVRCDLPFGMCEGPTAPICGEVKTHPAVHLLILTGAFFICRRSLDESRQMQANIPSSATLFSSFLLPQAVISHLLAIKITIFQDSGNVQSLSTFQPLQLPKIETCKGPHDELGVVKLYKRVHRSLQIANTAL